MNKENKLKEIRKKTGLNMKKFGLTLGVSERTVESWEQGRRKPNKSVVLLFKKLYE